MRRSLARRVARLDDGAPFLFNGAALPYWLTHARADATPIATYIGSDGLLKTVASAGAPRIDFTPGRRPGLLVESARTNAIVNSNSFTGWTVSNLGGALGAAVSPSGAADAVKINETAVNNIHTMSQSFSAAAGDYTNSRFFKQAERQWAVLQIGTDNASKRFSILIDLAAGAVIATNSTGAPVGVVYGVQLLIGGWLRAWVKATHTSGLVFHIVSLSDSAAPSWVTASPSYLGVANTGVYAFGGQLEAGAFPSSYIATGAAGVARAADALSMAARATDPLIVQTRALADGTRARTLLNPASDISTLADVVLEAAKLYPAGTPAGALASKLFVDGPW
jgi:hypothetical protein